MEDYVIDASCWHVEAAAPELKQQALEHFRDRYTVLLKFFQEEGLLNDADFGRRVQSWGNFEIRRSDLTEEGLELFKWCRRRWNPAVGATHTESQLGKWKSRLSKMRRAA